MSDTYDAKIEAMSRATCIAARLTKRGPCDRPCDVCKGRQRAAAEAIGLREMMEALTECADELEAEVKHRYGDPVHPAMQSKFERDMQAVIEARAAASPT